MIKSPGITFHPTNNNMFPQPKPSTTIQEYPQTEAAFKKDFLEVYENKGSTTYRNFIKATMQYNELELRNSLLNYLRSNNLWMSSDLISENVDEMIGYINFGHDNYKMVWRPEGRLLHLQIRILKSLYKTGSTKRMWYSNPYLHFQCSTASWEQNRESAKTNVINIGTLQRDPKSW